MNSSVNSHSFKDDKLISLKNDDLIRIISEKGQTVIPKPIREYCNIAAGDKLKWAIDGGEIRVSVVKEENIMDLYGALEHEPGNHDIEEIIEQTRNERISGKVERGDY